MPKTIYFAGAISGGRGDVALYRRIVEALRAAGHHVLAGAVASEEIGPSGEPLDACAIFTRDLGWIEQADLLVADVSTPSTGVGYEIAAARYRYNVPVIALYRPSQTTRCTAMVSGDEAIDLIEYTDESIDEMLTEMLARLSRSVG